MFSLVTSSAASLENPKLHSHRIDSRPPQSSYNTMTYSSQTTSRTPRITCQHTDQDFFGDVWDHGVFLGSPWSDCCAEKSVKLYRGMSLSSESLDCVCFSGQVRYKLCKRSASVHPGSPDAHFFKVYFGSQYWPALHKLWPWLEGPQRHISSVCRRFSSLRNTSIPAFSNSSIRHGRQNSSCC
jgi:hypothetical protein